jgi:uncharacterized protein DUF4383
MKTPFGFWLQLAPKASLSAWLLAIPLMRKAGTLTEIDRDRVDRIACRKPETRCAMAADPSAKAKEPVGPKPEAEWAGAEATPLVVWAARLSLYFLAQGGILLLSYAYYGFKTDPHSFALGFRLDPIHAAVHFVWGLVGTYIGFFRPRYATAFMLSFAVFYTVMAVLGTFTPYHLGMTLDDRVNLFHWFLVPPAWAIGLYGLWRERHPV